MELPTLFATPVLLSFFVYLLPVVFLFFYWKNKRINELQALKILKIMIGFFAVLYFAYAGTRFLEMDELEHIQSAWLVNQGEIPYYDFFQHHHPLLWYTMAPSFFFTGNGLAAVLFCRMFNLMVLAGIFIVIYRITVEITSSKKTALVTLSIILSINIFTRNAVAIRPDVPMTLFLLLAFLFFVRFWNARKNKYLVFSGLSLAVAFFFLQKAAFFILPFFMVAGYLWFSKKLSFKPLFILGISALIPVIVFLLGYYLTGYLNEYLVFNWFYNFGKPTKSTFFHIFIRPRHFIVTANFVFVFLLTAFFMVKNFKSTPPLLKASFFIGLFQFVVVSCLSTVYIHYYIAVIPFLLIPLAYFLIPFSENYKIGYTYRILFLFLLYGFTIPAQIKRISEKTIFRQMAENSCFVNSVGESKILSFYPQTVFIRGSHFFFFLAEPKNYQELTLQEVIKNPKYKRWITSKMVDDALYDPKKIINEVNPVFILADSDYIQMFDLKKSIDEKYESAGLEHSYRLKKE